MRHAILSAAIVCALSASAQSLCVQQGQVTYVFTDSNAGKMTYTDSGKTLTIQGRAFQTAEITKMWVDPSTMYDNTVNVSYGSETTVTVAGNVAQYVTPTLSGNHVTIVQADPTDEITYNLSGTATNASFTLEGTYKTTVELDGVSLTSNQGAAIYINNGKRIKLSVKEGTENTLVDSSTGEQKGCLHVKGHLELKGHGTLSVTGKKSDAIHTGEYLEMKNCTVNIQSAVKDGINCNQYFLMESGTLNILSASDEGIQVSYEDDTNRADIDTASATIQGGTINIKSKAKGLKAAGNIVISDGDITVACTNSDAEAIESKAELTISGGNVDVYSPDDAINCSSHMYISGGNVLAVSTGNDGLDSNGNMYISGGYVRAFGSRSPECGIDVNTEESYQLYITGGTILGVGGGNSTPVTCDGALPYLTSSSSVSAGSTITVKSGSDTLASFEVPSTYSSSSSGGGGWWAPGMRPGPGGGGGGNRPGGGGSSAGGVLIVCEGLTSGTSYTVTIGSSSSSISATTPGSASSGGGGWW